MHIGMYMYVIHMHHAGSRQAGRSNYDLICKLNGRDSGGSILYI